MSVVVGDIYEPINPITADTTAYTADASWPTADVTHLPAADSADASVEAAAGVSLIVEAADAADVLDAIRIPVVAYGGGGRRRRQVVEGRGYGILPPLRGEAHGVVGVAGEAAATLPISGAATGEADDGLDELIMMLLLAA